MPCPTCVSSRAVPICRVSRVLLCAPRVTVSLRVPTVTCHAISVVSDLPKLSMLQQSPLKPKNLLLSQARKKQLELAASQQSI